MLKIPSFMGMEFDPERAKWRQLAAIIRDRIGSGEYAQGQRLPAESYFEQEYGVTRNTVRRAFGQLRAEGLVQVDTTRGHYVRQEMDRETLALCGTQVLTVRMPSPEERYRLRLDEGEALIVIHDGGSEELYGANAVRVVREE